MTDIQADDNFLWKVMFTVIIFTSTSNFIFIDIKIHTVPREENRSIIAMVKNPIFYTSYSLFLLVLYSMVPLFLRQIVQI